MLTLLVTALLSADAAPAKAAPAPTPVAAATPAPAPVDTGAPVDFADDVKLVYQVITCQGGALPANLDQKTVDAYCGKQKPKLERFVEHWGEQGAMKFLATLRPATLPKELVYPFGGGDMMMALSAFPDAQVITTMSLELAGDPRRLRAVKDSATLKNSLQGLLETSNTTLLSNDSKSVNLSKIQRGELPGQLSMHLIGLALHKYEPVSVRYFRIEDDGTLHYYSQAEIDAQEKSTASSLHHAWMSPDFSPAFANVEVQFVPQGQPNAPRRTHRHIAADLSNDGMKKLPGLLKHLESKGHVAAMTKAASYLLWNPSFSIIRDYLTGHLDFMFADSTGVLPKALKKAGLTLETYGKFEKSFLNTAESSQEDLRTEFTTQPKRALPMRFGYPDGSSPTKFNHMVVVKRPAEAAK